jgi:hypothetical protein
MATMGTEIATMNTIRASNTDDINISFYKIFEQFKKLIILEFQFAYIDTKNRGGNSKLDIYHSLRPYSD